MFARICWWKLRESPIVEGKSLVSCQSSDKSTCWMKVSLYKSWKPAHARARFSSKQNNSSCICIFQTVGLLQATKTRFVSLSMWHVALFILLPQLLDWAGVERECIFKVYRVYRAYWRFSIMNRVSDMYGKRFKVHTRKVWLNACMHAKGTSQENMS